MEGINRIDVDVQLDELVGQPEVKEALKAILAGLKSEKLRAQFGQPGGDNMRLLSFVFVGNPGTGKTAAARLLGSILYNYGLIASPEVVVSNLVDAGEHDVEDLFENALGKVLYFDVNDRLFSPDSREVLETVIDMMTDERFKGRLVIIFSGFPSDMAMLSRISPRLSSRIAQKIYFDDYSNDELTEIFRRKLVSEQFVLDENALVYARAYFSRLRRDNTFGNARETEKLIETVKSRQGMRLQNLPDPTRADAFTILSQDFPNYGEIDVRDCLSSPMDKLRQLKGIDGIINQFERYLGDFRNCREAGVTFRPHMALMGNPGTGKTTVARLFADVLREEGLVEKDVFCEVCVEDLVSQYVGETRIKTKEVCRRARGGVLFLDEAYGLNGGYGAEALEVLLQFMENEGRSIVILAGYTKAMDEMLKNGNPGLNSRIGAQGRFLFEDYPPGVLLEIALAQFKRSGYTKAFRKDLHAILAVLYRFRDKSWANAHTALNIVTRIKSIYTARHLSGPVDVNAIPDDLMRLIRIPTPEEEAELKRRMDGLVGQNKVKEQLISLFHLSEDALRNGDDICLQMVFMGNPGTGKTTVAHICGDVFHALGFLPKGHFVHATFDDLVSEYVGRTRAQSSLLFERAKGGVLFIDEAGALNSGYGTEAVNELLRFLDHNHDTLVILADRTEEMSRLLSSDLSLQSRFSRIFRFEDYSNEELTEMLFQELSAQDLTMKEEAIDSAMAYFASLPRDSAFGNAREAQNLLSLVLARHRKAREGESLSSEDSHVVLPQDFPNYSSPERTEVIPDVTDSALGALDKSLSGIREVMDNVLFNVTLLVQNQASADDVAVLRRENEAFRNDSNMKLMRRYGIDAMIKTYQAICDRIFMLVHSQEAGDTAEMEIKAFNWVLKRLEKQFKPLGIKLKASQPGAPVDDSFMVVYGSDGEDVDDELTLVHTDDERLKDTVKESVSPAFFWTIPSLIGDAREWCMEPEKVCIYK